MPENPVFLLEGAVLIGVIAYLFYDSPIAAIFLAPLLYPYYRRRSREKLQQDTFPRRLSLRRCPRRQKGQRDRHL